MTPEAPVPVGALVGSRFGRAGRLLTGLAVRLAVLAVFLLLWQLAASSAGNPFFPTPLRIAAAAGRLWFSGPASRLFLSDGVFDDVLVSLGRLLAGWGIAVLVGVAVGIALGRSPVALDYVGGLLSFFRAVPPPALVPVFLVLFDIGTQLQLVTIAFGAVWPILLNTVDGARSVDPVQQETARAFRISRPQWILRVVLPAALPKIFAGLRISLSLALIMMVLSELLGSTEGIGYQLILAQRTFRLPEMWAGIVLLGVLGYLLNVLLLAVQRRVLHWVPGAGGG